VTEPVAAALARSQEAAFRYRAQVPFEVLSEVLSEVPFALARVEQRRPRPQPQSANPFRKW